MKILLLAPIHREKDFLKSQGKSSFPEYQAQRSYESALTALGHKVVVFRYTESVLIPNSVRILASDFLMKHTPRVFSRMRRFFDKFSPWLPENKLKNKKLEELANRIQPELIIFSGGTSAIFPETLKRIKENYHDRIVLLWGISPNHATQHEKEMVRSGIIDLIAENDCGYKKQWEKIGAKKVVVPPISGVDPDLHKKLTLTKEERKRFSSDVCFVGTLTPERQKMLSVLTKFKLKIWGDVPGEVGITEELKDHYFGTAYGEKMIKIFNGAKIVVNFQPTEMECGGNMRTFEIPGCGAFQLADRVDSTWFTNGQNIALFSSAKDLVKSVSYYLSHDVERRIIAEKAYAYVHSQHTYKIHFQNLLADLGV